MAYGTAALQNNSICRAEAQGPVPEEGKRVRLQIYVTPRVKKTLAGMSEDLGMPVGQIIENLLKGDGN